MAAAIGIGGAFMKAQDPESLASWYRSALNIDKDFGSSNVGGFGFSFYPTELPDTAYLRFSIEGSQNAHFPGSFMFNFIVEDIHGLLDRVITHGGKVLRSSFVLDGVGEFAWIVDPEGNRVELWEPIQTAESR